jgi:hypothetical protein
VRSDVALSTLDRSGLRATFRSVGYNNGVRRALDPEMPLGRRFCALRYAVERFSPNGFNATLGNLEQAVGVTDRDNWTSEQIVRAAELLSASHARYTRRRALWDEGRRRRKAEGFHLPSPELDGFGERSWFDHISYSSRGIARYRWIGLAEWVQVNGLAPGPFGPELERDFQKVMDRIPPAQLAPIGSMLAHYGPPPSSWEPGTVIRIPERVYNNPITDSDYRSFSDRQRLIADAWYSRSHDGFVRQRLLNRIIPANESWVVPYVVAALGDYVVEIVHEVDEGLKWHARAGTSHLQAYRQFAANNDDFITLMRQRATSYQHCYYSGSYSRQGGASRKPIYPAFSALAQLEDTNAFPRLFRVPIQNSAEQQRL